MNDESPASPVLNPGILAGSVILAGAGVFASSSVFHQFGGYDLAPLIDLFWRMGSNETPGIDFINTWPPLILLLAKAFAVLRLGWYELTAANIVAAAVTVASLFAATPRTERSFTLCTGLAMPVAIPLVYTNHIWHSSLSQYGAAVFFVIFLRSLSDHGDRRPRAIWLFLASGVVVLTKQNVALPVLAGTAAFALVLGGSLRPTLLMAIGSGAAAGIAFAVLVLPMPLTAFVEGYTAVAGRGLPGPDMLAQLEALTTNLPTVSLCLAAVAIAIIAITMPGSGLSVRQRLLVLMFLAISAIPIVTDWDAKLNDVTLPLIIALVAVTAERHPPALEAKTVMVAGLIASTLLVALVGGANRERMASVGRGVFWEPVAAHRVTDGYFRGLYVGDNLDGVLREMTTIADGHRPLHLFFGPRLEFGYAALRTPSPSGMPLWWHPGSSYAQRDEPRVIAAFAANKFDALVFLGNDRTRMPTALLDYIDRHYRPTAHKGRLQIFEPLDHASPPIAARR